MGSIGEIIQWTLNASSVILIVFLLEFTIGRKMKKTYQCALWGIVLVRLLIPSMPSSSWSLLSVFPQNKQVVNTRSSQFDVLPDLQTLIGDQDEEVLVNGNTIEEEQRKIRLDYNNIQEDSKAESNNGQISNVFQRRILYIIWLVGTLGLGSYWVIGYIQAKRKIKKLDEISDETILKLFEECKVRVIGKHRGKNIKLVAWHDCVIFGILKPIIALSRDKSEQELEVILLHELTHYRYKDYLLTYVQLIVLSLHWFNPLVWLAVKQMKEDMEYACDERVIRLGISKKNYANTLLSMIHQEKEGRKTIPYMPVSTFAQGMGSGMQEAKHRIKKIAGMKKSRLMGSVLSIVLVSFLAVGCLTDAPVNSEKVKLENEESILEQSVLEETKTQNIAVFGLDDSGLRADTIFVGSINDEEGSVKITSIPRDTKIVLEVAEKEKIEAQGVKCPDICKLSELVAYSGKSLIEDVVLTEIEKLVGIQIDHYVLVDVEAAEEMIDAMGGIEVNVPQAMVYDDNEQNLHIHLEAGKQYLAGYQVMGAVRFRHSTDYTITYPDGDLGRVKMTQSVIQSILQKIKTISSAEDFITLAQGVSEIIDTNLPLGNLMSYYNLLSTINLENIQFDILSGEIVKEDGRFYYIVDKGEERN